MCERARARVFLEEKQGVSLQTVYDSLPTHFGQESFYVLLWDQFRNSVSTRATVSITSTCLCVCSHEVASLIALFTFGKSSLHRCPLARLSPFRHVATGGAAVDQSK